MTVEIPRELGDARAVEPVTVASVEEMPRDAPRERTPGRGPGRVRIAMVTGGVGLAALLTGGGTALSGKLLYDDIIVAGDCKDLGTGQLSCNSFGKKQVDIAGTRANIGTGFVVGGTLLVVTAVVLYVTAPKEALTAGVSVAPTVSTEGIGLAFSGRF